jgi:hypothetical protein
VKYLQAEERKQIMPTLFDSLANEDDALGKAAA